MGGTVSSDPRQPPFVPNGFGNKAYDIKPTESTQQQQQEAPSSTTATTIGAKSNPFEPIIPPDASPLYKKFPRRNIPDEFKPTAAVVGSGLAGIHSAWELSRLGFKVTVYDQFRHAGEGATKFDSGLVVHPRKMMHPEMAKRIFSVDDGSDAKKETSDIKNSSNALSLDDIAAGTSPSVQQQQQLELPESESIGEQQQFYSSSKYFTYQPLVWRINATKSYFKSLVPLFFSGTTPVVASETPLGGIFRESWRTWSKMRRQIKPNDKTLITHATELQEATADLIDEMIKAEPERLGKLVVAQERKIPSSFMNSNNNGEDQQQQQQQQSVGWRVIDTSRWCRTMADILEKEYGVEFKYSNIVTRMQWRVDDTTEWVSSVVNTDMPTKKVFASAADLIVIAAGSMSILQRDNKANEGYKLPLLSVAGWGLDIPISMLGESAKSILLRSTSLDSLMPYQLSDSQFIRAMPTPPSAPVPLRKVGTVQKDNGEVAPVWERVEPREGRLRISGLCSLLGDDVKRNVQAPPSECIRVLSPRLNQFVANAANKEQATLLKAASEGMLHMSQEFAVNDAQSGVSGFRFSRGYTADGLPLISKLGNARNTFLVCGFGDDAALLAPGSAKYLSDMIMKKKPASAQDGNPFSLDRFYKYDYLMKYDDNFDTFQERWYKGENWMESFGQPIIDRLWTDFWNKGPGFSLMSGEEKEPDYGHSKTQ